MKNGTWSGTKFANAQLKRGQQPEGDDDDGDDRQEDVLLDNLLTYVGFADGRASTNAVSDVSMQQAMQADKGFTDQLKGQVDELYGIYTTAWAAGGVSLRSIRRKVKGILQDRGMTIKRVQQRCGKKNKSTWGLKHV